MKKIMIGLALLVSTVPAFAGLPVTSTLSYQASQCIAKGGKFTFTTRKVGTIYVVSGYCDTSGILATIGTNMTSTSSTTLVPASP